MDTNLYPRDRNTGAALRAGSIIPPKNPRFIDQMGVKTSEVGEVLASLNKELFDLADRLIGSPPEVSDEASARDVRCGATGCVLDSLESLQGSAMQALGLARRLNSNL